MVVAIETEADPRFATDARGGQGRSVERQDGRGLSKDNEAVYGGGEGEREAVYDEGEGELRPVLRSGLSFIRHTPPVSVLRRQVLKEIAKDPDVRQATHVVIHHRKGRTLAEVVVAVDPQLRVGEAESIGRATRKRIENHTDIDKVDVHLELDDGE